MTQHAPNPQDSQPRARSRAGAIVALVIGAVLTISGPVLGILIGSFALVPQALGYGENTAHLDPSATVELDADESILLLAPVADLEQADHGACTVEASKSAVANISYEPASTLNTLANGTRYESFGRVTACAMPATLTVLTIVLAFAPRIDGRFLKLLGDPGTAGPRNRKASPRVLGILLIGFSILLVTLHVALVSLHTPQHLPIAPLISTAAGVLLILLGLTLPMNAPQAVTGMAIEERLRETQRRAYRRTAPLLMLAIGLGTITAAWFAPTLAMPIAVGGVAFLFLGIAATAIIRSRTR